MITRIEIDGFKSFQDFSVDLKPFQVIIGPNGCGKSNLLEAIYLLSKLADSTISDAFEDEYIRGQPNELFTITSNGKPARRMRLAVEIRVDPTVQNNWGEDYRLKYRDMRYQVEIALNQDERGFDRLTLVSEALHAIKKAPEKQDAKFADNGAQLVREGSVSFIQTTPSHVVLESDPLYSTGNQRYEINPNKVLGTVLSVEGITHPHVLAARQEMRNWRFLHLNPVALRKPSFLATLDLLNHDGSNLGKVLARMNAGDSASLKGVSRDLANFVPGLLQIEVEPNQELFQYIVWAKMQDGRRFHSQVLSDGALRLLALATLRNDPEYHGVLCLEEPENGIHPATLKRLVPFLRDMATDVSDPEQVEEPLSQLLVTTHSPEFVTQLDIKKGELLVAEMVTLIIPNASPMRVTQMRQVYPNTVAQVIEYLNNADITETRDRLYEALKR